MMGSGSIRFDSFNRYKKASSAFVHVSLMHKETLIYSPSTVVAVNHHPVRRPSCFRRSHFSPLTTHPSFVTYHLSPITNIFANHRSRKIDILSPHSSSSLSLPTLPSQAPLFLSVLGSPWYGTIRTDTIPNRSSTSTSY